MLDDHEQFLRAAAPQDQADRLIEAGEMLNELGVNAHETEMSFFYAAQAEREASEAVQIYENLIYTALLNALHELGVFVQEAPLTIMVAILQGAEQILNYGDPMEVVDLIDGTEDTEEKFADILELVTDFKWDDYLGAITFVHPGILINLRASMVEQAEQLEQEEEVNLDLIRKRLKSFLAGRTDLMITSAIADGISMSRPMDVYTDHAQEYLHTLSPKQAAEELVAIALASNVETDCVGEAIRDQIDVIYTDVHYITKVDVALTEILNEGLNREKT